MLGQARPVQLADEAVPSTTSDDEVVDPDVDVKIGGKADEEIMELLSEVAEPDDGPTDDWTIDDPDPLSPNSPARGTIVGVAGIPLVEIAELRVVVGEAEAVVVAGIDGVMIDEEALMEDTVFVRETVQPRRFRQTFTQRMSVHVVVDAGAARLVDSALGLPVKEGLEIAGLDEDWLGDNVEEDATPDCRALLEEDVVPVKETVQPRRFRQTLTHRTSVQVVVEANPGELVPAELRKSVTGGLVVAEIADVVLNVKEVLGNDRVHLVPRPKQTFAHRRSVHVVVNIPEELEVVALVNPVTGGELIADNVPDEDSNDGVVPGVVPGPETLVVKDMVHAVPRFRHASTHRKSVQVAVVTGLVVAGFDVAKVVLGDDIDPNDEVWVAKPEVLNKVEDVTVKLIWLGFGIQVGPRHRLRQSKPEQEGVGDNGMFVMLEDVMVGDVLETVDNAVGDIAVDPKFNVLVSRLLVVLAETDGVDVKMLVGVAVEQPGPTQTDTHSAPLQDVVNNEDRLVILVDAGAEEMLATEALDVAEVAAEGTEEGNELRLCSVDETTFEEGVTEV
ncbi:MAG: hypothetical protein Q9204_006450 [Flavoplaca sp. TL-2023a]